MNLKTNSTAIKTELQIYIYNELSDIRLFLCHVEFVIKKFGLYGCNFLLTCVLPHEQNKLEAKKV